MKKLRFRPGKPFVHLWQCWGQMLRSPRWMKDIVRAKLFITKYAPTVSKKPDWSSAA